MYYKYKKYIEYSPNGTSLDIKGTENVPAIYLGNLDGFDYAYLSEPIEQDERLGAEIVDLTVEQKELLKLQRYSAIRKQNARFFIDKEVGDIQDLIADAMKMIEFNIMLTARLAGDIWGTNPIVDAKKTEYSMRNKAFLDAVDAGDITLRGDFDNMDIVMSRLLSRVSKINQIVRDTYINDMKEIGFS